MKPRRLSDVARAVRGSLAGDDVIVRSVAIDSREVLDGDLFVALPRRSHRRAAFVADAFERGAAAAMVARRSAAVDGPVVHVGSTNEALLRLATDERRRIDATVVAVTGANGKTSTKDMVAAVWRPGYRTHASPRSFNNEIGCRSTILSAPEDTEVIVAELGARHVGDVAELCAVARPDIAVVTNVGRRAHGDLRIVGDDRRGVGGAGRGAGGRRRRGAQRRRSRGRRLRRPRRRQGRYGSVARPTRTSEPADVDRSPPTARRRSRRPRATSEATVRLPVPGEHMVANALAALAVGREIGVPLADGAAALRTAPLSRWRMETFVGAGDLRVINDAYNANPESTAAALRTARWMAGDGRLIAVLGQMAELGDDHHAGARADRRARRTARRRPPGRRGRRGARDRRRRRARGRRARSRRGPYDDVDGAIADVRAVARPGDVVVCKGSRVAGLERVAEALR